MKYTIVIKKIAEKFIVKLPQPEKERVLKAIYQLPGGNDIRELKGKKNKGCTVFVSVTIGLYTQ